MLTSGIGEIEKTSTVCAQSAGGKKHRHKPPMPSVPNNGHFLAVGNGAQMLKGAKMKYSPFPSCFILGPALLLNEKVM